MPDVKEFDAKTYIVEENQREADRRAGKSPEAIQPKVAGVPGGEEIADTTDSTPRLPRSVRREMNRLREEKARAEGRLEAFKEFQGKPREETTAAAVVED